MRIRGGQWAGIALGLILLGALCVRLWGTGFGLPAFAHYHPDEHAIVNRAATILQVGDWSPPQFNYPPFYIHLQVAVLAGGFLWGRAQGYWSELPPFPLPIYYHLARTVTATFGTATVVLVYLVGKRLFSLSVGLIGAALLAGNYLHIIHSHYATLDIMVGFLVTLCLLFSARLLAEGQLSWSFLAGLCTGLAAATKYNGAVSLAIPLAAQILAPVSSLGWKHLAYLLLPVGGLLSGFLLGNPFALERWTDLIGGISAVWSHYGSGQPGFEGLGNWRWYLHTLLTSADALWAIVGIFGLAGAFWCHRRSGFLLGVFPALYFGLVSLFVVRFERNLVPLLPFLALGGGWLLSIGAARIAGSRAPVWSAGLAAAGTILVLALPLGASLTFDRLLSATDHREIAGRWLEENIEAGAQIAVEHYSIPFDHTPYQVTDVVHISDHDVAWYRQAGYDLLVVSDGVWEVLRRQPQFYGDRLQVYDELVAHSTLLAEFVPTPPGIVVAGYPSVAVYHFAPVRIYRLNQ